MDITQLQAHPLTSELYDAFEQLYASASDLVNTAALCPGKEIVVLSQQQFLACRMALSDIYRVRRKYILRMKDHETKTLVGGG